LEAEGRHAKTDWHIAIPKIINGGIGWQVADDHEISREELALEFQAVMLSIFRKDN